MEVKLNLRGGQTITTKFEDSDLSNLEDYLSSILGVADSTSVATLEKVDGHVVIVRVSDILSFEI